MPSDAAVIADVARGVATDALGNGNSASTSTDNTVTYDTHGPTVTVNQAMAQADPTNASPIQIGRASSKERGDFATGAVTLSGTAGGTTARVTGRRKTYEGAGPGIAGG